VPLFGMTCITFKTGYRVCDAHESKWHVAHQAYIHITVDGTIVPYCSGLIIFQPPSYFHGRDPANTNLFMD
jgi:hypothetical protein